MTCERCERLRFSFFTMTVGALTFLGVASYLGYKYDADKTCVTTTYQEAPLEVCGYNLERQTKESYPPPLSTPTLTPSLPGIYKQGEWKP